MDANSTALQTVAATDESPPRITLSPSSSEVQDVTIHGGTFNIIHGNASFSTTHVHQHISYYVEAPATEDKRGQLLRILPTNGFRTYHQAISEKKAPGTGALFLNAQTISEWMAKKAGRLWCTGAPGIGKTFLTFSTIERQEALAKQNQNSVILFAYLQHSAQLSTWEVLVAFVRQVIESTSNEALISLVDEAFWDHHRKGTRPTVSDLARLLQTIVKEHDEASVTVDGLDEFPPEQQMELLDIILSLEAKVMVMSRPLALLTARLERQQVQKPVFYDVMADPVDLDLFIAHELDKIPGLVDLLEEYGIKEQVVSKIKDKAEGMFLHAALHVQALRAFTTPQDILDEVERFPRGLEGLYADIIQRIHTTHAKHAMLAKRAILWLLNVKGMFTMNDLRNAVSHSSEEPSFDPMKLVSGNLLLSLCHGLVVVDKSGTVQLVHYTAYEILPVLLSSENLISHEMITRVCIARLFDCHLFASSIQTLGERRQEFARHALLDYAYKHSVHDFHISTDNDRSLQTMVEQFIRQCISYPYLSRKGAVPDSTPLHQLTPLHVAVLFDMPDLVLSLIKGGMDPNTKSGHKANKGWTGLMLAAREGRTQVVEALMQFPGLDMNTVDEDLVTPLLVACRYGNETTVRQLLEDPQVVRNINHKNRTGMSALMVASRYGHEGIVSILLHVSGVDANGVDRGGWSPLMVAATFGHVKVVSRLLAVPGINVNQAHLEGWTALMKASGNGHLPVVEMLLDVFDIEVNRVDRNGMSALAMAAENDHVEVLQALLKVAGVQVNLLNKAGLSALMTASCHGLMRTLDSLLAHPETQPNLVNAQGWSALMLASKHDQGAAVQRLLGVPHINAMSVDGEGRTALVHAASAGHVETVRLLLNVMGASNNLDTNLLEQQVLFASEAAERAGFQDVAHLLRPPKAASRERKTKGRFLHGFARRLGFSKRS